jgi:hypothetical protein
MPTASSYIPIGHEHKTFLTWYENYCISTARLIVAIVFVKEIKSFIAITLNVPHCLQSCYKFFMCFWQYQFMEAMLGHGKRGSCPFNVS